jgi:hypothetical protein
MLVLDTDHITHLQWAASPKAIKLSQRLTATRDTKGPLTNKFQGQAHCFSSMLCRNEG